MGMGRRPIENFFNLLIIQSKSKPDLIQT